MMRPAFVLEQNRRRHGEASFTRRVLQVLEETAVRLAGIAHGGHFRIEPFLPLLPEGRVSRSGHRSREAALIILDLLACRSEPVAMSTPDEEDRDQRNHADAKHQQTFLGTGEPAFHRIAPFISKVAAPSAPISGWTMLQP